MNLGPHVVPKDSKRMAYVPTNKPPKLPSFVGKLTHGSYWAEEKTVIFRLLESLSLELEWERVTLGR